MTDPLSSPPPMTRDTWRQARAHVEPHDHAIVVFDQPEDLLEPLAAFVEEGLAKRELIVFVHSFSSDEEAWEFLQRARGDAPALRSEQALVVSLYRDAFEGGRPRIDYEHVGNVVASLDRAAAERERSGVRIFVDASRRYFAAARTDEWFAFESWLGRRLQARVGLVCAYQRGDVTKPDVFAEALRTHAYRFGVTSGD